MHTAGTVPVVEAAWGIGGGIIHIPPDAFDLRFRGDNPLCHAGGGDQRLKGGTGAVDAVQRPVKRRVPFRLRDRGIAVDIVVYVEIRIGYTGQHPAGFDIQHHNSRRFGFVLIHIGFIVGFNIFGQDLLDSFLQAEMIRETKAEGRRRSYLITSKGQDALDEEYRRLLRLAEDYQACKEGLQ